MSGYSFYLKGVCIGKMISAGCNRKSSARKVAVIISPLQFTGSKFCSTDIYIGYTGLFLLQYDAYEIIAGITGQQSRLQ
jgi:hypothetical protein